jgi:hypothetical protein
MDDDVDDTAAVAEDVLVFGEVALSGRRRDRLGERRTLRLTPRFTAGEVAEIASAAAQVGMTPNGFCAEVVLKVVRRQLVSYEAAQERQAMVQLQRELFAARTAVNRFGSNVNQAVAKLHTTGESQIDALAHAVVFCGRAVRNVDALIDQVHELLRR